MRPVSIAALALLLAAPSSSALQASAAAPLKGTVKKSFTATGVNGRITSTFRTSTPDVYASFVWLRAPTAGQGLAIDWFGPSGARVAEWKDRTLVSDTAGTRIYSFIGRRAIETRPGRWRVAILVAGVQRATISFVVAKNATP